MLQRSLTRWELLRLSFAGVIGIAFLQCGSGNDDRRTSASGEAIIGGAEVDAPGSPVLFLRGPEGTCSAVLIAPTLIATARHCVANTTPGMFSCTASGDLVLTGSGAGQIGNDDPPGSLAFFNAARVGEGSTVSGAPDAVGAQIVSTQTSTVCRDDLAFVVLDRTIRGLLPAPIRIDRGTAVGENVSVWGYGLTDQVDPVALRTRGDAQILGVGPDVPSGSTQLAPVRAVRTGPVTCQGDSGGPILSAATGALIAIVSLGSQAGGSGPFCNSSRLTDTIGPRLAGYHDLVLQAFQAAGGSLIPEPIAADAASATDVATDSVSSEADVDSATDTASATDGAFTADVAAEDDPDSRRDSGPGDEPAADPKVYRAIGASCSTTLKPHDGSAPRDAVPIALAWAAAAAGRRRRR